MRYLYFLISLFFAINAFGQTYFELVDSADLNIKNQQYSKAEKFIIDALRTEPANMNNTLLLSNLATIQRNQLRLDEALKNYTLALHMTPNATVLLSNRASLLLEMDSIEAAYSDFERLNELDKNNIDSRYNHGMIALIEGNVEVSKKDFDEILSIDKNSIEGKMGLALWYKHTKEYDSAIKLYTELLSKKELSSFYVNRAECYLWKEDLNLASQDINEALKIDDQDGYAYLLKAKLSKLRYENDDALRYKELAKKYGIDQNIINQILK